MSVARHGGHDAADCINSADSVVPLVSDKKIAVLVYRDSTRGRQTAFFSYRGYRGDDSCLWVYPPDSAVEQIGDKKSLLVIHRHVYGRVELSSCRRTAVL